MDLKTRFEKEAKGYRPYLYFWYWTGNSFQIMQEVFSNANDVSLFLLISPSMSLHCKLVFQSNAENTNMVYLGMAYSLGNQYLAWPHKSVASNRRTKECGSVKIFKLFISGSSNRPSVKKKMDRHKRNAFFSDNASVIISV